MLTRISHEVRMALSRGRWRRESKHGSCCLYVVHRTPKWLRIERLIGRTDYFIKREQEKLKND